MTTFEIPIRVTIHATFSSITDFQEAKLLSEIIRSKVRRTLDGAAVVKSWSVDLPNEVLDDRKENFK